MSGTTPASGVNRGGCDDDFDDDDDDDEVGILRLGARFSGGLLSCSCFNAGDVVIDCVWLMEASFFTDFYGVK